MYDITFKKNGSSDFPFVLKAVMPGQSLLEIAIDHSLGLPHECGGMCSCGTCHVLLEEGSEFVEFRSKRESHQLARRQDLSVNSRLACQCVLLPGSGSIVVSLPVSFFSPSI